MKIKKKLAISLAVTAALAVGVYANRLLILQYSLGWTTDFKNPREANHPVPWID